MKRLRRADITPEDWEVFLLLVPRVSNALLMDTIDTERIDADLMFKLLDGGSRFRGKGYRHRARAWQGWATAPRGWRVPPPVVAPK